MRVLILSALVAAAYGACPNSCSGQGVCGANDKCSCFQNWQGPDCSLRTCTYSLAWADTADGTNSAHYYAECSNKGVCDRKTGDCKCFDGYEGKGCRRSTCPEKCSGHGTCEYIDELAGDFYDRRTGPGQRYRTYSGSKIGSSVTTAQAVPTYTTRTADTAIYHGFLYDLWDSQKIQGCKCDLGFDGPDCSHRISPKGDDPLTTVKVAMGKQSVTAGATGDIASEASAAFEGANFADVAVCQVADGAATTTVINIAQSGAGATPGPAVATAGYYIGFGLKVGVIGDTRAVGATQSITAYTAARVATVGTGFAVAPALNDAAVVVNGKTRGHLTACTATADDEIVGMSVVNGGETKAISAYTASTKFATYAALTAFPGAAPAYTIAASDTVFKLGASAAAVAGRYVGATFTVNSVARVATAYTAGKYVTVAAFAAAVTTAQNYAVTNAGYASGAAFIMVYHDPYGGVWRTDGISASSDDSIVASNVQAALRLLPNEVLDGVSVLASTGTTAVCHRTHDGVQHISAHTDNHLGRHVDSKQAINGCQSTPNHVAAAAQMDFTVTFADKPGQTGVQYLFEIDAAARGSGSFPVSTGLIGGAYSVAEVITTANLGTLSELAECSDRGLDNGDGECECFDGFRGLACEEQEALV